MIQLFDVTPGLFSLRCQRFSLRFCRRFSFGCLCHRIYILQIRSIGEIDDGDNRGGGDERIEARDVCDLGRNACGGCARKICD